MINCVSLKCFKSHTDTTVTFHHGVNVFVGLSDHGKTNLIRAINWVANNRPLGDGIIQKDSSEATVELTVSNANNSVTVHRTKGDGVNKYVINGDTECSFTAFGSDPPVQIKDTLNLSEINLQRQFEPYFLVFDPPGQVATFIRSITKLDEIDRVIDNITSQIDKNKVGIKVCESENSDVLARLGAAVRVDLNGLRCRIDQAKFLIEQNKQYNGVIDRLTNLIEQIDAIKPINLPCDLDERIESTKVLSSLVSSTKSKILSMTTLINQVKAIKPVILPNSLNTLLDTIKQKTQQVTELAFTVSRLRVTISSIQMVSGSITTLPDLTGVLNRYIPLERKYNGVVEKRDRLLMLINDIHIVSTTPTVDEQVETTEREINDLRGQLTLCPTCGSELNEERKEKVLRGQN